MIREKRICGDRILDLLAKTMGKLEDAQAYFEDARLSRVIPWAWIRLHHGRANRLSQHS